jgi:hypothetical protein
MHEKMKADRYILNFEFDKLVFQNFKPIESAFAQQQSPKKQRDKEGSSPSHHEHRHDVAGSMIDLNFDQGFTGEFPKDFSSLQDEGKSHKKLILVPSIIPTTAELKIDISFEPVNYNTYNPVIQRRKPEKNKQAEQIKFDKLDKLRLIGRPLVPLTLDCKIRLFE